jgi:hypothetical protein
VARHLAFGFGLLKSVIKDFVVPVMYLRNVRFLEALGVFRREVVPGHLGSLTVFYLLKILMAIGTTAVVVFVTCLTCCLAGIPYIGSVVFLPFTVFFRSYSLCFLAQLGPQWSVFDAEEEALGEPPPDLPHYDPTEFA